MGPTGPVRPVLLGANDVANQPPRALETLRQSVEGGFVPYAFLLRDPALDSFRGTAECWTVLELARTRFEHASISFHAADGPRLMGMTDVARS